MQILFVIVAFVLGMLLNVQSGVNGLIREITANPIFASTVNFLVGFVPVLILLAAAHKRKIYTIPDISLLRETRWWMWTGGLLGIIFVMASALLPAYIGYGAFFSMLVTGQLVFSAMIDHNGWLGNEIHPIDRRRALGILFLVAGAVIVQNT